MSRLLVILKRPFVAVFLLLLLQMAAGMVVLVYRAINGGEAQSDASLASPSNLLSISLLVTNVLTALMSLVIFRRKQYTRSQYVPSTSTWRQDMVGMAGCFLGIVALDILVELFGIPNMMEQQQTALCSTAWGVAAIVLGAPLAEELLFRWGIMGHLLHHNRSVAGAIFVSALFFGIIHINPAQVFFATIMGILLGMLYWKTGNIFLPLLLHIINNSVACLHIRLLGEKASDYSMVHSIGGPSIAWGVVAVCSVLCLGLMGWYAVSRPAVQEIDIEEDELKERLQEESKGQPQDEPKPQIKEKSHEEQPQN